MRKLSKILSMGLLLGSMTSCTNNGVNYDLYRSYHDTAKGLEVYCWKYDDTWYSGILPGTNRFKNVEEVQWLQDNLPCPLNTMSDILDEYKENNESIGVFIVSVPPKEAELFHEPDNSDDYRWVIQQLKLEEYMND